MYRIMKRYKYIIGLLLLLIPFMVSAQQELENYLLIAAENNPGLRAKFNEYMAALEVVPQAKALPDPQIALKVTPLERKKTRVFLSRQTSIKRNS